MKLRISLLSLIVVVLYNLKLYKSLKGFAVKMNFDIKALARKALDARNKSYSPYSHFRVGAALLCKDGKIYIGANIENAAYAPTNCAERTAFFSAVMDGQSDFAAIFISGGAADMPDEFCPPCGVCRQVMREFCNPEEFRIFLVKSEQEVAEYRLCELLPMGFGPDNLER